MSENDPDPNLPDEGQGRSELGGRPEPDAGDPTRGGKRGQIGEAPSVAADQPADGSNFLPRAAEEPDAPPVADPGPGA